MRMCFHNLDKTSSFRRMFQFSIRELFLLSTIVAFGCGWWLDRKVRVSQYDYEKLTLKNGELRWENAMLTKIPKRDVDEVFGKEKVGGTNTGTDSGFSVHRNAVAEIEELMKSQ